MAIAGINSIFLIEEKILAIILHKKKLAKVQQ